jgi:hypothetical protein
MIGRSTPRLPVPAGLSRVEAEVHLRVVSFASQLRANPDYRQYGLLIGTYSPQHRTGRDSSANCVF